MPTIPKTLAGCADRLKEIELAKKPIKQQLDALDEERIALEKHLIEQLPRGEATGVRGKLALAYVELEPVPQMENWPKFWAAFKPKTDSDLLQRRLNNEAVRLRWEARKVVPGVVVFMRPTLRLKKV